tara:strand:+ start:251 stop:760 length:510 start_codon:yes stop_codon:yes gene_type:complete
MAKDKPHLRELVPSDCKAINEVIDFAIELAEREKKHGWEEYGDANKGRTPLSRQLSSIVTGKLEKGCSWYDFAPDSSWMSEGKIDEVTLRIFKASELYSHAVAPGKGMHHHDAFACLVVASTTSEDISERVELVRKRALHSGLLPKDRKDYHEYSLEAMERFRKSVNIQ